MKIGRNSPLISCWLGQAPFGWGKPRLVGATPYSLWGPAPWNFTEESNWDPGRGTEECVTPPFNYGGGDDRERIRVLQVTVTLRSPAEEEPRKLKPGCIKSVTPDLLLEVERARGRGEFIRWSTVLITPGKKRTTTTGHKFWGLHPSEKSRRRVWGGPHSPPNKTTTAKQMMYCLEGMCTPGISG